MSNEKKETLLKIRMTLDKWEETVNGIGNECAYTDRMLDGLPELAEKLCRIGQREGLDAW